MSLTYITKCDSCGERVEEWPEGSAPFEGWAQVSFESRDKLNNPRRHDYCPKCWEIMFCSVIRRKA